MTETSIKKISAEEFNLLYGNSSRLAAYYVNTMGSVILSAFLGNESVGYIIYDFENSGCTVRYIFVHEQYRRHSVARQLLGAAETLCINEKRDCMKICVSEKHPGFEYIKCFLLKNNYAVNEKVYLFRCDINALKNWEDYMKERGKRLAEWIEMQGYKTVSFNCMSQELMSALRETPNSSYNNNLDIASFLDGKKGRLVESMCYLAFKDNTPAAYCLVTSPDKKSVVFEQISVAENHRNIGVILLPFVYAMKRCRELGYERAVYAMYEGNPTALAFANRFLSKITEYRNVQYNFRKNLNV